VPQRTPLLSSSRGTRPSLLAPTLGVLTIAASLVLARSAWAQDHDLRARDWTFMTHGALFGDA
jgi:hypothetical protein